MELVAASRLRRAQARIEALRPYADRMQALTVEVAAATSRAHDQPLLARRDVSTVAVIALTADRGLAGGFNANVVRRSIEVATRERSEGHDVVWLTVGRRGTSTLRFRGQEIEASYTGMTDRPAYSDAQAIAERVADIYTELRADRVVLVYNRFVSALAQKLEVVDLLPVPESLLDDEAPERIAGSYLEEPGASTILSHPPPPHPAVTIYRAPLASPASEQGARMPGMRSPPETAGDLIASPPLQMTPPRQSEITQQ